VPDLYCSTAPTRGGAATAPRSLRPKRARGRLSPQGAAAGRMAPRRAARGRGARLTPFLAQRNYGFAPREGGIALNNMNDKRVLLPPPPSLAHERGQPRAKMKDEESFQRVQQAGTVVVLRRAHSLGRSAKASALRPRCRSGGMRGPGPRALK